MSGKKIKRKNTAARIRVWLFPWRRSFRRRWSLLIAALVVLPILALLLTTVRVRVFFAPPALNRSGEIIVVPDTPDNRVWLEKIVQKTPFPDVNRVPTVEALADTWLQAEMRPIFEPGQQLRMVNVPVNKPVFEQVAVLPPLPDGAGEATVATVQPAPLLQPRLRWLTALKAEQMPVEWPDYAGTPKILLGLRYMVEVDREGRVVSCVPAVRESDKRAIALENWLKRVRFPESKLGLGWIACEVIWEADHD